MGGKGGGEEIATSVKCLLNLTYFLWHPNKHKKTGGGKGKGGRQWKNKKSTLILEK